MKPKLHSIFCGLLVIFTLQACLQVAPDQPVISVWEPVNDPDLNLPAGVELFAGTNKRLPLKAWYLAVRIGEPEYTAAVVVSDDQDRRETLTSFASDMAAVAVINGGYFRQDLMPSRHVGLLKVANWLIQPSINYVTRVDQRYFLTRAAVGFDEHGFVDMAWTFNRGDTLFEVQRPPEHRPGQPDSLFNEHAQYDQWPVEQAIGGGPMLISDGEVRISTNAEVFFGTSIPNIHPRTAYGYRADSTLILLVVDGRQAASRGVDLEELADIMLALGCVEALNMDGGGSTALIVRDKLINRPIGSTNQREVMSALAIFDNQHN